MKLALTIASAFVMVVGLGMGLAIIGLNPGIDRVGLALVVYGVVAFGILVDLHIVEPRNRNKAGAR